MQSKLKKIFVTSFLMAGLFNFAKLHAATASTAEDKDKQAKQAKTFKGKAAEAIDVKGKIKESIAKAKTDLKAISEGKLPPKPTEQAPKLKEDVEKDKGKAPEKAPEKEAEKKVEATAMEKAKALLEPDKVAKEAPGKTLEKIAMTPAQQRVADLIKRQFQLGGQSEADIDKGYWDAKFQKLGAYIAFKFPNATASVMEKSLNMNEGFKKTALGKLQSRAKDFSADFKTRAQGTLMAKFPVTDKEVEARKQDKIGEWNKIVDIETGKIFEKEQSRQKWQDLKSQEIEKNKKSGMAEDVAKVEAEKEVKKQIEASVKMEAENNAKSEIRSQLVNEKMAKKLDDLKDKKPEEYQKMIDKINAEKKKRVEEELEGVNIFKDPSFKEEAEKEFPQLKGLTDDKMAEEIKKMKGDTPEKYKEFVDKISKPLNSGADLVSMFKEEQQRIEDEKSAQKLGYFQGKKEAIKDVYKNLVGKNEVLKGFLTKEVEDVFKDAWAKRMYDFSQKVRQFGMTGGALAIGASFSAVLTGLGVAIGKAIEKTTKAQAAGVSDEIAKDFAVSSTAYGQDQLTPEDQRAMDALDKLTSYYSTMDVRFKNALSNFDYYSRIFQTAQKVPFAGGEMTAGIALLFTYQGAGNIAQGLTPVITKFYPIQVLGNPIDPIQALVGVTNLDSLEIVNALRGCDPNVIFLMKAIALLNTANKKFPNLVQRKTFLDGQMNLLFARLIRTVDDVATRRANAIEKDDEKWEPVYMKTPAKCFQAAPKVLRDFIENIKIDALDEDGKSTRLSFEQYVVNQFDEFDDLLKVDFEGDIDYEPEDQELDDKEVTLKLFAIFMRALDYVLDLEKELLQEAEPVTIIGMDGKKESFDCKKFYMDSTEAAFSELQTVQNKFVDAMVEYATDLTNVENEKTYNTAFNDYVSATQVFVKSMLTYRKKVSLHPFEKTLGYEPERVLDFVYRECKRTYLQAKNKQSVLTILPNIFAYFAENFPFTTKDLLTQIQKPGPVKSPVRSSWDVAEEEEKRAKPVKDIERIKSVETVPAAA